MSPSWAVGSLICLACLGFVATAHAPDDLEDRRAFEEYVEQFGKQYAEDQREARFEAFRTSLHYIQEHNAMDHSYKLALNEHSDMSPREFGTRMGFNASQEGTGLDAAAQSAWGDLPLLGTDGPQLSAEAASLGGGRLPASVDWRGSGCMTPVLDQGHCGGCWSFSATAAISAAWELATGILLELSQQQLLDCSGSFGNQGCQGGNMASAFIYARTSPLCSAASYPYEAAVSTCRQDSCSVALPVGAVVGYRRVQVGSEEALMAAVEKQPVAIGIEAEQTPAFQLYRSGVMSGVCGTKPNHGVLLVGYGTEDGQDYWLIKNSWGPTWGENGYFKLARGNGGPVGTGECGILSMPSYPVVDASVEPAPTPSPVPSDQPPAPVPAPPAPAPAPPAPPSSTPSSTPAPSGSGYYGRPPCRVGEGLFTAGSSAAVCVPRCHGDGECPDGGECNLSDNSWMGWLFDKRYCSLPCFNDMSCPGDTFCVQRANGFGGVCMHWLMRQAAETALLESASPRDEQPAQGAEPGHGGSARRLRQASPDPDIFS